ncbi:FkbM family methyltransferase [Allokutzneria sp. NRRL B-24872]|uniref:FkbM family methyltransferase n=1 Tax=Allokutzneria sp. NRRL B-24872 TaxID=1137961 RepID=UPI000A38719E|nr:FkbM family methyltransferase [Allokutzneria sp. NRRL B-24872]
MTAFELHCVNAWEAAFLREEVRGYFDHRVSFSPGATVIDAGANIGAFSAAVHERLGGDVRIYAFEPLPPLYALLERNAREFFTGGVTAFPFGLGSSERELDFSYFPGATLLSSSLRNEGNVEAERRRITASIVEMIRKGGLGPVARRVPAPLLRFLVGRKTRVMRRLETHRVLVRSLSSVIDEQGIDRIDVLKIDVEGAELDVLHGIEERHWPLVRQAVVEVEGWRQNHDRIREVFTARGFDVAAEQGAAQRSADIGMVFAVR